MNDNTAILLKPVFQHTSFYLFICKSLHTFLLLQLCCLDLNAVSLSVCPSVQSWRTPDVCLGLSPCQLASGSAQKHQRPGSPGGRSWCVRSLPLVEVKLCFLSREWDCLGMFFKVIVHRWQGLFSKRPNRVTFYSSGLLCSSMLTY